MARTCGCSEHTLLQIKSSASLPLKSILRHALGAFCKLRSTTPQIRMSVKILASLIRFHPRLPMTSANKPTDPGDFFVSTLYRVARLSKFVRNCTICRNCGRRSPVRSFTICFGPIVNISRPIGRALRKNRATSRRKQTGRC